MTSRGGTNLPRPRRFVEDRGARSVGECAAILAAEHIYLSSANVVDGVTHAVASSLSKGERGDLGPRTGVMVTANRPNVSYRLIRGLGNVV